MIKTSHTMTRADVAQDWSECAPIATWGDVSAPGNASVAVRYQTATTILIVTRDVGGELTVGLQGPKFSTDPDSWGAWILDLLPAHVAGRVLLAESLSDGTLDEIRGFLRSPQDKEARDALRRAPLPEGWIARHLHEGLVRNLAAFSPRAYPELRIAMARNVLLDGTTSAANYLSAVKSACDWADYCESVRYHPDRVAARRRRGLEP